MRYYNKRGMAMEFLLALIIFVVVAVILFLGVDIWKESVEKSVKQGTCKWSALIKNKLTLLGFESSYELKCNPIEVEVDKDEDINDIVVENMYDCWKTLGEGKLDIISSWSFTRDTACVVCSIVYPDKGSRDMTLKGLENAMNRPRLPDEDKSFINYFAKKDEALKFETNERVAVNKENPLYVVYFFYKLREGFTEKGAEEYALFGGSASVSTGYLAGRYGSKIVSFVARKTVPKLALGGGIGLAAGVLLDVAYRSDLRQGIAVLSGKEIINGCEELK